MKKCFLIILSVCFCFLLTACENETKIHSAHISEMTGALSTDYAIKVIVDEDDRMADRFVDLQLRSSEENQILQFGQELGSSYSLNLPKSDYWYNLTYLISKTNGANGESYVAYEDFGTKVYTFSADNDVNLTFRVVAGKVKTNETTGEEILVVGEDISQEVEIEVKKHQDK